MRRARLKVAASVPVRRKPVESKPVQPVSIDSKADIPKLPEFTDFTVSTTPQLDKSPLDNASKSLESPLQLDPKAKSLPDNTEAPSATAVAEPAVSPVTAVPDVHEEDPLSSESAPVAELSERSVKQDPEFKVILSTSETICASPTKSLSSRSCFIRPVPRLDGHGRIRRNSVQGSGASASESEDESRRLPPPSSSQSRLENVPPPSETGSTVNSALGTTESRRKRRTGMSESARKLVEARREFMLKHDNIEPDRSKLTMYDLIYYNPVTNPMKKRDPKPKVKPTVEQPVVVPVEEEEADDPDENAVIAPRVTVDAEGRLVIDEKSLTIQRTGIEKAREMIAAQEAEEEDNYGSGFYKRRKRSKDWSILETIKFYKALNTVGTDFLLMQCLFPERTRQELKLKYKKEERVNPSLVEKALTSFQVYDIDSLKEDLESCTSVEETPPALNAEGQNNQPNSVKPPKRSKFRRLAASSIVQTGETDGQPRKKQPKSRKTATDKQAKSNVSKQRKRKTSPKPIECSSRSDDSTAVDSENSDSNHEDTVSTVYKLRITRSGRKPRKVRRLIETQEPIATKSMEIQPDKVDTEAEEVSVPSVVEKLPEKVPILSVSDIKKSFADVNCVEPGSLVIVSKESSVEPDKTIVQVFMVSGNLENSENNLDNAIRPLELSPEMLSMVQNVGTSVSEKTIKEISKNESFQK